MKKTFLFASLFIAAVCLWLWLGRENPREWIQGQWYEPNYAITATITADHIELSWDNGRNRLFSYELKEGNSPYQIEVWEDDRANGVRSGWLEFDDRNKAELRPKTHPSASGLEELAGKLVTRWRRVEEKSEEAH